MDDTFLIFKDRAHVQQFWDFLNSKHSKIQFTCEIEENNTLPFLDINVIKTTTAGPKIRQNIRDLQNFLLNINCWSPPSTEVKNNFS